MGKTCSMDPEKGFHEVHIEDNIEVIPCKRKIELYNAVVEEREDFTVEAEVLREVTSTKNTILHVAAKSGNMKIAKKIIDFDPSLLHEHNSKGDTPLHIAASLGHLDMTNFLLSQHQHMTVPLVMITNESNETALHGAVRNGHKKIAKKLIEKDPSLTSLRNKDGESPLFIAVDRGFFDIAEYILDNKECCEYRGSKGRNILHAAAIRLDEKFMEKVMDKFPKAITEEDDFGWTPLHYAAHFGEEELVKLFLNRDIFLAYKQNNEGMCALHISAKKGHVDVMGMFIERCPYTCQLFDKSHRTALHLVAESGHTKALKIFFKNRKFAFRDLMNEQDDEGNTPFHIAAANRHYALLMSLADRIIMSNLERHNVLWSLDTMVDRQTIKVKNPKAEGTGAANSSEENGKKDKEDDNKKAKEEKKDDIKDLANFNLVVATIIATVTFAAAFQVPGGTGGDGLANLREKGTFVKFLIYDSLAFGFSAVSIFANFAYPFLAKATRITYPIMFSLVLTEFSLICLVLAFIEGTRSVLTENSWLPEVVYASLFPISFFLVRPIIVRKTFLFSSRKLPCT
ncbi:protein accelerated cell death 6 [Quercus suber]|uniref:Protein accelerated cell death 6 n=1 Tax=Quercus suber TaxID=58331 RepID=A0AAW0IVZ4_QUESU